MDDDQSWVKLRREKTEQIVKDFDFPDLEQIHGRELTFFEKRDAIYRFSEFISILRVEYEKMLGAEVFITRDSEPGSMKVEWL